MNPYSKFLPNCPHKGLKIMMDEKKTTLIKTDHGWAVQIGKAWDNGRVFGENMLDSPLHELLFTVIRKTRHLELKGIERDVHQFGKEFADALAVAKTQEEKMKWEGALLAVKEISSMLFVREQNHTYEDNNFFKRDKKDE